MSATEAHRRIVERAQVRAMIRAWAAAEGIPCPDRGRIPLEVMAAWDAGDQFHLQYGIGVDGADPIEDDLFGDMDAALAALGDPGRERLMVRTVTSWMEA